MDVPKSDAQIRWPLYLVLYSTAGENDEGGISLFFSDFFFSDPIAYEALETFGAQLYSGPETSPTIKLGVYPSFLASRPYSVQIVTDSIIYGQGSTTISIVAAPVPVPGTGLMMVAGCVAVGAAARRRVGCSTFATSGQLSPPTSVV